MQRRNVHAGGARSPPPLAHPMPHHPARSPPITSASFDDVPAPPQHSSPQKGVRNATGPSDYQRFTSPPPAAATRAAGAPTVASGSQGFGAAPINGYTSHAPAQQFGGGPMNAQHYTGYGGAQPAQAQAQAHQHQQQIPRGGPHQDAPWGGNWANDATAQMGMQFGKSAVAAGQEYMERNFVRHLPVQHLQHSFNVSNYYVVTKLRLVLWPWKRKTWARLIKRSEATGQPEGYLPARDDVNSPDLYIPTMALVTYILLSGVVAGSESRFHPEILGVTASKASGIVILEFICIKLGCYLLDIGGEGTVVDLLSYSGYKFVGIIVVLLGGLLGLTGWLSATLFVYVFAANGFFLLRSLRYVVLPDPALQQRADEQGRYSNAITPGGPQHVSHAQRGRRIRFLFGIAASQLLTMWWLSRV